jgi:hypothetical protein
MNPIVENPFGKRSASGAAPGAAEATLRLIAQLPVPAGLEDRVQARLHSAPRPSRVLAWPAALRPGSNWMRAAAAAVLAFVVAGGGWGIYSRVQPGASAKGIVLPPRGPVAGGFSSAGAMRTPQTLNGPVVAQPVAVQPPQAKPSKKVPVRIATKPLQPAVDNKTAAPPVK